MGATPIKDNLISVVVPVFNEEAGIAQLRERLDLLRTTWNGNEDIEFIFVDDGSSDNTLAVLRASFATDSRAMIAVHPQNRGIGAAFRTGFAHCRGSIVCTIDADCSYGPENLWRLVEAVKRRDGDIAVASPYHPLGGIEGVPAWRLGLSRACSALYGLVASVRLYTYTSVFRAYRREVVDSVAFREDGFVSASEFLILAAEQGYAIAELPMVLHTRKFGQSKMKVIRTIRGHLLLIGRTVIRRLALGRPSSGNKSASLQRPSSGLNH